MASVNVPDKMNELNDGTRGILGIPVNKMRGLNFL